MAEEQGLLSNEALIAMLEREHEESVIKFDDLGNPVGLEEHTPRGEALFLGVFFTLFGGVFFFVPLGMMLVFLQDAYLLEMFCLVPFFGIFLLVGGTCLTGGLKAMFSGITGKGLSYVVTLEELAERKEEEHEEIPTAFSYPSRDELLSKLQPTSVSEPQQPTASTEDEPPPAGGFWGDISESAERP